MNNNEEKKNKSGFKTIANVCVSAVAIILSIVALVKGGPIGPTGPQGQQGQQGEPGNNGNNGSAGKSAYEIAVENGFVGTEAQWIESLKATGVDNSLNSIDDYFELLDSTRKYNYEFEEGMDENYNHFAGLKSVSDAQEIYNNVESASYTFRVNASILPMNDGSISEEIEESSVTKTIYHPTYTKMETKAFATMEINRIGEGNDSYVALNMISQRDVLFDSFGVYYEDIEEFESLVDTRIFVYDLIEFTKIGEKYYLIYCSPTFGYEYYVIQEFSKETYEYVVASIIYDVTNSVYSIGKDFYLNKAGADYYKQGFVGSKTDDSAKAQFSSNYKSEFAFENDKLLSLSSTFDDSLCLTLDETSITFVEQNVSIVYGDSNHQYSTELPTEENWQYAGPYWYEVDEEKDILSDLVDDKANCTSLIYQMIDIFRNTYKGIAIMI